MPNISLTGPIAGHPLDIATQQAQQAQAAEIAMAMLKQGLTPEGSPVVHTGGNNPFARDVVNLAPLGRIGEAYFGNKNLEATKAAQQATAQDYNERVKSGMSDLLNSMTPHQEAAPISDEGPNPPVTTGGTPQDVQKALITAAGSQIGPVQDIAKAIMSMQMQGALKRVLPGADEASLVSRGNVIPKSIPGALTDTLFGPVITHPEAFQLTPSIHQGEAGAVGATPRDVPADQAVTTTTGVVQPPRQPLVMPGQDVPSAAGQAPAQKNDTGVPMTYEPSGQPKLLANPNETPAAKTTAEITDQGTKVLQEGREKAQDFQKMAPVLGQMVDLVDNARLGGPTAAWVTKAQQFAKSIGLSNDEAGHIVDQQTLMKYATPQAYSMAHGLTSRPAVVEVLGSLAATAADPSVDPNTAKNVYRGFMVKGLNDLEIHNQNIDKYGNIPEFGKSHANVYSVNSTPEQILGSVIGHAKSPYSFERNNQGVWRDLAIGTPQTRDQPSPKAGPKTIHWNDLPE